MRRYNLHYDHFEYMITITSYNHDITVVATRVLYDRYYYCHYHSLLGTATLLQPPSPPPSNFLIQYCH